MIHDPIAKKIIICGDLILDEYFFGETKRISPEAPVPILKVNKSDYKVGGAGNVAMNIKSLGGEPLLFSVIGNDNSSKVIKKILNSYSIKNKVKNLEKIETVQKKRFICQNQQLIRVDFERNIYPSIQQFFKSEYKKALHICEIIILSDYLKGTLNECKELIDLANDFSVPVLVDPKGKNFKKYSGSFLITPNLSEFETMVGHCDEEKDLEIKGRNLLDENNIENLLITKGEKGFSLIPRKSKSIHIPANARDVYDVTGAGDTFIATLAVSLSEKKSLKESAIIANMASGIVVGKVGTSIVNKKELEDIRNLRISRNLKKIYKYEEIKFKIKEFKSQNKNIIMTNGCFDILHAGHIDYLKKAKNLGGILFVAVNDDNSVRRLKGKKRPVNNINNRMKLLSALEFIDYVFSFSEDTPEKIYREITPDILVKGGDYKLDEIVGAKKTISEGGKVEIIPFLKGFSTTDIIKKIIKQNQEK